EAVEPLLTIAETRDFFLSFAALGALQKMASPSAVPRILPLLTDEFLRPAAIQTLGVIGDEEIISPLVELLNKDKSSVSGVAESFAAFFYRFENISPSKGRDLAKQLRDMVDSGGKSNLLESLDEEDLFVLTPIVELAGRVRDEKIREKLAALVEDENIRHKA